LAGPGRPAQPGRTCSPEPPAPTVVATLWFDHWPITDRSRGRRLIHPSITRHPAAPQPPG
jgi:hypothetical protein